MSKSQLNTTRRPKGDNVLTVQCYYIFGHYALCIDPALKQRGLHMLELFKRTEVRRLKEQIERFKDSKYFEYINKLLVVTEARDITEVTRNDVRAFMSHFSNNYASSLYVSGAGKAIRFIMREYRKIGYPVLMAWEVKMVCREFEPWLE